MFFGLLELIWELIKWVLWIMVVIAWICAPISALFDFKQALYHYNRGNIPAAQHLHYEAFSQTVTGLVASLLMYYWYAHEPMMNLLAMLWP